jgi:hypothetical protein
MAKVWEHSQAEKEGLLVMLALADHADDSGYCYPGIERIARKCRVSSRTVQRHLKSLCEIGELRIERGRGVTVQGGVTNRYQITVSESGDKLTPGDKTPPEVVTKSARSGDRALTYKPSVEPSEETSGGLFSDEIVKEVAENERNLEKLFPFHSLFNRHDINDLLKAIDFGKHWRAYVANRKELRKPLTERSALMILTTLAQRPHEACAAIEAAIEKGWTGIKWEWIDSAKARQPSQGAGAPKPKAKIFDAAAIRAADREKRNVPNLA